MTFYITIIELKNFTFYWIKKALIIHEEKTKGNHYSSVVLCVLKNHVNLHKCSRLRQRLFLKLLRQWTHKMGPFIKPFKTLAVCALSEIKGLGFNGPLYGEQIRSDRAI